MIPGFGTILDNWDPTLTRGLSKRFKLILFDPPGSGRSELSDREPSIRLFADQTSRLMDVLGISKAHVLGISMGSMIAQELAINYPEKVQKLILCSSSCGRTKPVPPSVEMMQEFTGNRSNLTREDMIRYSLKVLFTEEFLKNNSEHIERNIQRRLMVPIAEKGAIGQRKAIANFSTYERLHMIKAPTLILHGKKDVLVPPENAAILTEAIPKATLVYFENSAHSLAEEIEKVLETIMNFLD